MQPPVGMRARLVVSVLMTALSLGACASDGGALDGEPAPGVDPPAPPPPGGEACAAGEHACGEACRAEQANDPAVGCALGCGTPCEAPANGRATCGPAGTCDFTCDAGFVRDGEACIPFGCEDAGYTCGTLVDERGNTLNCGTCAANVGCGPDHHCAIASDAYEPNDVRTQARTMGDFDDSQETTRWVDNLSVDAITDEDWFSFKVVDRFDGGNPEVVVQLTDRMDQLGWLDSRHELTVWFRCDSQDAGSIVRCGEWATTADQNGLLDPALGVGCEVDATYRVWADILPSCTGLTDSGTATLRVRKTTAPRGDTYDLFMGIE